MHYEAQSYCHQVWDRQANQTGLRLPPSAAVALGWTLWQAPNSRPWWRALGRLMWLGVHLSYLGLPLAYVNMEEKHSIKVAIAENQAESCWKIRSKASDKSPGMCRKSRWNARELHPEATHIQVLAKLVLMFKHCWATAIENMIRRRIQSILIPKRMLRDTL